MHVLWNSVQKLLLVRIYIYGCIPVDPKLFGACRRRRRRGGVWQRLKATPARRCFVLQLSSLIMALHCLLTVVP